MCEILTIELRIVARARHRSHIHESANAMRLQHLEEFRDGTGRMADGENAQ
jgi:hypothetical protein